MFVEAVCVYGTCEHVRHFELRFNFMCFVMHVIRQRRDDITGTNGRPQNFIAHNKIVGPRLMWMRIFSIAKIVILTDFSLIFFPQFVMMTGFQYVKMETVQKYRFGFD